MTAKDFRELRVYQLAFETAFQVYLVSKEFPPEERYSMTDQVRRSSRSVCTNIAEAWRKRRYPNNFVSKLSDADMEAAETVVWLDIALRQGFISPEAHRRLSDDYDHVCSQLSIMMDQPDKWIPKGLRREK
jgi:four helix bundle protein